MPWSLANPPWTDNSQRQDGYIYTTTADAPYSASYKIPGTIQSYLCRKGIHLFCTEEAFLKKRAQQEKKQS